MSGMQWRVFSSSLLRVAHQLEEQILQGTFHRVHTDDVASGSPESLDRFPFQSRIDQNPHAWCAALDSRSALGQKLLHLFGQTVHEDGHTSAAVEHFGQRALPYQPAAIDDDHAVGELLQFRQDVGTEENGLAHRLEREKDFADILAPRRMSAKSFSRSSRWARPFSSVPTSWRNWSSSPTA